MIEEIVLNLVFQPSNALHKIYLKILTLTVPTTKKPEG